MKVRNFLALSFSKMIPGTLIIASLLLASCSSFMPSERELTDPLPYLHDELFAGAVADIQEPEFFLTLPDTYKRELDRIVLPLESEYQRYRELRSWVYRKFENYEFDTTETYSLGELNTSRKINCLSFSAIFVAAARYVNVPADFQLVYAPPYWDEENGTWINNQHIDVTGSIGRTAGDERMQQFLPLFSRSFYTDGIGEFYSRTNSNRFRYVVDINPAIVSIPLRRKIIGDQQALSLYFSNKSMESLIKQDLPLAYAYTKQALLTDPLSTVAWNNLGVLYSRIGQLGHAHSVYQLAIELDSNAYSARSNLARVYQQQGKFELADAMLETVEEFRRENPYYHQALADEKFNDGEYIQALAHLEDAVSRKHNEQHFYHRLAVVHQKLGNRDEVVQNLTSARRWAKGAEKGRYSGKLKMLEDLLTQSGGSAQ